MVITVHCKTFSCLCNRIIWSFTPYSEGKNYIISQFFYFKLKWKINEVNSAFFIIFTVYIFRSFVVSTSWNRNLLPGKNCINSTLRWKNMNLPFKMQFYVTGSYAEIKRSYPETQWIAEKTKLKTSGRQNMVKIFLKYTKKLKLERK